MAGLGEQRLGLLDVIGVALEVLVVAGHRRRQRLVGRHRAVVDQLHDAVLVDRHVDGLAHLHVVERRHLRVHRHVAGVQLAALDDARLLLGIGHHLLELGRRDAVAGHVDLALLQAQQRDDRLLADLEGDLVEMRQALVPVVGVALEHQALAERPFGELVGAGADRMLAEIGAVFLDLFLRHDMREIDRHDMQEGGVGPGQLELDRMGIDDGDAFEAFAGAGGDGLMPLDRGEEAGAGALGLRVDDALDRVFDVVGGHLAAVVEFHALAQLEGEGLAVGRDLVAFGEVGHQHRGAGLVVHQPVEQALDHRPVLPVVADRRIERGDVVLVGDGDGAALLGVGVERLLGDGRRHGEHQRERRRGEGQG